MKLLSQIKWGSVFIAEWKKSEYMIQQHVWWYNPIYIKRKFENTVILYTFLCGSLCLIF